jgi:hypothetical protein
MDSFDFDTDVVPNYNIAPPMPKPIAVEDIPVKVTMPPPEIDIRSPMPSMPPSAVIIFSNKIASVEGSLDTIRSLSVHTGVEQELTNLVHKLKERRRKYTRFDNTLTAPLPPPIDRRAIRGILAFREWEIKDAGKMQPLFIGQRGFEWSHITYANQVPNEHNLNGLYARRLTPELLLHNYNKRMVGFIELLGHIEEHGDGVCRAEVAKMLTLLYTIDSDTDQVESASGLYESIRSHYPLVRLHVVSKAQVHLFMAREVLAEQGLVTGGFLI